MADDILRDAARPALSLAELGILLDDSRAASYGRRVFRGVASLDRAGPDEIALFSDGIDPDDLSSTRAGGCVVARDELARVPAGTLAIVAPDPGTTFAGLAARFAAATSSRYVRPAGIHRLASVASDLRMEADVAIGPFAVIGRNVEIGRGTTIGAHCVVADDVAIGRDCWIADHVSIAHAFVGDRVRVGPGARLGAVPMRARAGFVGRLIVQDGVEVGANATLERGLLRDTVIGEAASIGVLVAVAADARVERHGVVFRTPEMVSDPKMV